MPLESIITPTHRLGMYDLPPSERQHALGSDSSDEEEREIDDEEQPGPHVRLLRRQSASEAQIDDLDRALKEDPALKTLAEKQSALEKDLVPPSKRSDDSDEGSWEVFEEAPSRPG